MLRVGSNFTGIGAWEKGLANVGIDYKMKFFSEIDKYAYTAYCAVHNKNSGLNIGDITQVKGNEVEDIDLFVYSPPCQTFSVAGKQAGFEDRRGVLFFDSLRIIENKRPPICLMENVKNLASKKFKNEFASMLKSLEDLGYKNYWKVLNLKDYGLPQNRERLFIVSLRNDIDDGKFEFPKGFDSGLRLKDMLEEVVDEKYYISGEKVKKLLAQLDYQNKDKKCADMSVHTPKFRDIGNCITARYDCGVSNQKSFGIAVIEPVEDTNNIKLLGNINNENFGTGYAGGVWDENYLSPTITTMQGGGRQPHVLIDDTKSEAFGGGKVWENECPCLRSSRYGHKIVNIETHRVRKLTPKECWRLQGFSDEDFDRAKAALNDTFYKGKDKSNSQLYKMAGNSIGVKKLEALYKSLEPYFEKVKSLKNN